MSATHPSEDGSSGKLVKTDRMRSITEKTSKVAFTDKDERSFSATTSSCDGSSVTRRRQSPCEFPPDTECDKFLSVEDFSQNLIDSILDEAVVKVDIMAPKSEGNSISFHVLSPVSSSPRSVSSESNTLGSVSEINWPSIGDFNIGVGAHTIEDYLGLWYLEEDWKYYVKYTKHIKGRFDDYYLYEAIFGIPIQLYPVVQVTATIYFTIEVSRCKPSWCLVDVSYHFEGSRRIHHPGVSPLQEQWLFYIVDAKLRLFRSLGF